MQAADSPIYPSSSDSVLSLRCQALAKPMALLALNAWNQDFSEVVKVDPISRTEIKTKNKKTKKQKPFLKKAVI